jgi:hypothetical protein
VLNVFLVFVERVACSKYNSEHIKE